MSKLQVDDIVNKGDNGAPGFSKGVVVTGVATATTFSGNLTGNVTGNADTATTATTATNAQGITGTPDITVRNVTGVGATFSGDVNISGTLTYEDVTNIDSVGIITAQAGVRVLGAGVTVAGIATFHNGANFDDILIENVTITAGKLSDNTNINVEDGMVHLFTTTETTTSTPNIRFNGSTALNARMSIGDTISITLITTAAAAAYSANITIDGSAVTERWNGGSAPTEGGSSGNDVYSFQIIKTADATYTVLGNVSNFA